MIEVCIHWESNHLYTYRTWHYAFFEAWSSDLAGPQMWDPTGSHSTFQSPTCCDFIPRPFGPIQEIFAGFFPKFFDQNRSSGRSGPRTDPRSAPPGPAPPSGQSHRSDPAEVLLRDGELKQMSPPSFWWCKIYTNAGKTRPAYHPSSPFS